MRISLAQSLVAIAFLALGVGWYASQRRIAELERIHEEKIDETLGGISTSTEALTRIFLAEALETHDEDQFRHRLQNDLVWSIYMLSSRERTVDNAEGEIGYACYLAQRILKIIGCSSPAEFAAFARENFGNDSEMIESFPEYYDAASDAYRELAKFVQRSLENEFVPSWAE
jgi:hypothetical protein